MMHENYVRALQNKIQRVGPSAAPPRTSASRSRARP